MNAYINPETSKKSCPALFLDRDGVINFDHGHVYKVDNFDFLPGIFDLLTTANEKGYLVVVVTNQAGIGRGLYSEKEFHDLTTWMIEVFKAKNIIIDGVFYSPFHPTLGKGEYLLKENTRKPGSGMFKEALTQFDIDINKSLMIGDSFTDMEASINAGIKENFFLIDEKKDLFKYKNFKNIKVIESLSEVTINDI